MTDNVDAGYGLAMPFLLVESRGGPYADEAFTSGYRMGMLDADLRAGNATARAIHVDEYEQADLIAMRHGYGMATTDVAPEDVGNMWLWVDFALDKDASV